MFFKVCFLFLLTNGVFSAKPNPNLLDVCGINNGKRLYVEFGISGTLSAHVENFIPRKENAFDNFSGVKKCSVEFVTCPSCIIELKFSYLNISRSCDKTSLFDTCGCDYVLLNEPPFQDSSGEQFCGRFRENNVTHLGYISRTRSVEIEFTFSGNFGHAFSLEFTAIRNRIQLDGYPKIGRMNNNSTQVISSPFFPHLYSTDLSVEYVIACHYADDHCRISLIFTDFLLAHSSIIEFFDWNGTRMYVTSGSVFRPPVIVSSGPSLTVRFYANGASDFGFKATYSFILNQPGDTVIKPNINCGGHVTNLGGGITMMNMLSEGATFFDCLWLMKPPSNYMHRKTHLYIKVVNFSDFAGTTELVIRQGLTSNEPVIETVRYPVPQFNPSKQKEHVVPITEGFYINLRGSFKPESQVTIVYAAFNYKDCFSGLDFLCHNLRCISMLLNCDGFDHCGDNSDESSECSEDPRDHRRFSKIPNFLFPKNSSAYSDLTTASFVFLICTFGLIGIIFAMALLLYRVNGRAKDQRRIRDHLETIHAILEEGVGEIVEEEIITPDDPPDYEPPPEYTDVLKYLRKVTSCGKSTQTKKCTQSTNFPKQTSINTSGSVSTSALKSLDSDQPHCSNSHQTSKSCQTTPDRLIPESPPPAYENISSLGKENPKFQSEQNENLVVEITSTSRDNSYLENLETTSDNNHTENDIHHKNSSADKLSRYFSSKILEDIGLSWKRIKKRNENEIDTEKKFHRAKRMDTRGFSSEENLLVRHSSEILFQRNLVKVHGQTSFWAKPGNIKKSFSTADIFFSL